MNEFYDHDLYEILEVSPDAPQHEIHRAYQRAKNTYSQENPALYTMFSREEAQQVLKLIEEAYAILGNPTLRESYNHKRGVLEARKHEKSAQDLELPELSLELPRAVSPSPSQQPSQPESLQFPLPPTRKEMETLPDGFGRTKYSTYKIDEEIEESIRQQEYFDGPFLRMVREYKNINLQQISEDTKISLYYLVAVENNDYVNLPAAVFVRGFVQQYSKILGLEPQKVANSYMKVFKDSVGR